MSKSSSFINSQLSIAIFDQDVMKEVGRTFIERDWDRMKKTTNKKRKH